MRLLRHFTSRNDSPTFDLNWPTNKVVFIVRAKNQTIEAKSLKIKDSVGSFYE